MTVKNEEKDLLAGAFVDEPPLRVDVGQLVARGRRRRLVRQTGTVAGVAVGVASIAVVSLVVAGAHGGGQVAPAGPATGGMTGTKTPWVSTGVGAPPTTGHDPSQRQGSLGPVSRIQLPGQSQMPSGSSFGQGAWTPGKGSDCDKHPFYGNPVNGVVAPTPGDPRAQAINEALNKAWQQADLQLPAGVSLRHGDHANPMCVGNGGWSLFEEVATPDGYRVLEVEIWPTATRQRSGCARGQDTPPMPGCTVTHLSDGTELWTTPDEVGQAQAIRQDGTTVSVMDIQNAPDQVGHPVLPAAVLSHIATLPGLAVRW